MRLLTFSTLYPNQAVPHHGIFVETRLRYLLASGRATSEVVAPVPWFPSTHPSFGRYAAFARAPREERHHGIRVLHPRYVALPAIGMTIAPFLLAAGARRTLRRLLREGGDGRVGRREELLLDQRVKGGVGRELEEARDEPRPDEPREAREKDVAGPGRGAGSDHKDESVALAKGPCQRPGLPAGDD